MKLKVVVGILVLVILGFTVFGDRGLINLVSYQRQREAMAQEVEKLKAQNQKLTEEILLLKTDRAYLERMAREQLGMVKPGELVFQFTEAKDAGADRK